MTQELALAKELSANDLGLTQSHQSGIFIPRSVTSYFPNLDELSLNPSAWLSVVTAGESCTSWRYVHYNNGVVADGTRDEYRVTRCQGTLRALGARVGDVLLLRRTAPDTYLASLSARMPIHPQLLVLHVDGPWRTVRLGRS